MKTILRYVLKAVLFVAGFYLACHLAAFFVRKDAQSYARVMMHELHDTSENIDILFLGASHTEHAANPFVASEIFGKNAFNAGTGSQRLPASFALLKEAASLHHLERVFLDLDIATCDVGRYNSGRVTEAEFLITNYMKNKRAKVECLMSFSAPKYYPELLLPIARGNLICTDPREIVKNIYLKCTGRYYAYEYPQVPPRVYAGKGYVYDTRSIPDNGFIDDERETPFDPSLDFSEWERYLHKIAAFCKEEGITLTLFSFPENQFYIFDKGDYDEYISFVKSVAAKDGLDFYDFNLCKAEYLELKDSDFYDRNHLNGNGAEKFMRVFSRFFTGQLGDDIFYASYAQKMESVPERIYGIIVEEYADKSGFRIVPATNGKTSASRITYDFSYEAGGKTEVISRGGTEPVVAYPSGTSGELHITSYLDGVVQNKVSRHFNTF